MFIERKKAERETERVPSGLARTLSFLGTSME